MSELQIKYKAILNNYGISSNLRLAHFFSQIEHESNLKPISENFNYSTERLLFVFPKYFSGRAVAIMFEKKPEKIANRVYANRMGNGNENSGDGWKYRGRGFIQITGKNNYIDLSIDTGIDFVSNPDLLLNEANSLISALWFWKKNNLNLLADKDNVIEITKKINGGVNGLKHRTELLTKYKNIFK
jgi:putative chitinase